MNVWILLGILGMLSVCLAVNQIVIVQNAKHIMADFSEKLDSYHRTQRNDYEILSRRINDVGDRLDKLSKDEFADDEELCDALDAIEDMIEDLQDEMDENERVDNAYGEALKSFSEKIDEIQEKLDALIKDISALK